MVLMMIQTAALPPAIVVSFIYLTIVIDRVRTLGRRSSCPTSSASFLPSMTLRRLEHLEARARIQSVAEGTERLLEVGCSKDTPYCSNSVSYYSWHRLLCSSETAFSDVCNKVRVCLKTGKQKTNNKV